MLNARVQDMHGGVKRTCAARCMQERSNCQPSTGSDNAIVKNVQDIGAELLGDGQQQQQPSGPHAC